MTGKHEEDGFTIDGKDLPQKFILKMLGHCETKGLWGVRHTREPVDKMVKFAKDRKLCLPIVQLIVTREGLFVVPLDFEKRKLEKCQNDRDSELNIKVTIPESEISCLDSSSRDDKDVSKVKGHCFRIKAHLRIVRRTDRGRSKAKKKVEDMVTEGDRGAEKSGGNEKVCRGCGREQFWRESSSGLLTDMQLLEKYKRINWKTHGIMFYPVDNISYGVQDLVYTRVFSMIEVLDVKNKFDNPKTPFVCHSFVCENHNTAKMLTYSLDAAFQAYGKTLKKIRSR